MKKIVILQPQFFPWVGVFEQIKLADEYVHFDDVQFPQGRSFTSRVQIKTPSGSKWMTIPVLRNGNKLIKDIEIDNSQNWKNKHIVMLEEKYSKAPFFAEMKNIVEEIYSLNTNNLCDLNIYALEKISDYFNLNTNFRRSSLFNTTTNSSQKLFDIIQKIKSTTYITGHGAKNYLDHELFEKNNIKVEYMDYQKKEYPQLNGEFNPFVSILDLIANTGKDGVNYICSGTKYWKEVINV